MTEADLPARKLWADTEGVELAEGDSQEELAGYLRRNPNMSYVAVNSGQLCGAVLAGYDGRRGFLYHLAVAADRRRDGLGQKLVEQSLAALKAAGVVRVLILVARDNPSSEQFWRKRAWEPLGFAQPMGRDL